MRPSLSNPNLPMNYQPKRRTTSQLPQKTVYRYRAFEPEPGMYVKSCLNEPHPHEVSNAQRATMLSQRHCTDLIPSPPSRNQFKLVGLLYTALNTLPVVRFVGSLHCEIELVQRSDRSRATRIDNADLRIRVPRWHIVLSFSEAAS